MSDATTQTTQPLEHRLWTGRAPLATADEPADIPRVRVYPAAGGDGSTIVICPGGAYHMLAAHESGPIAKWLNTVGINAVLLTYRLSPRYRHPAPLLDVSRAIRTTRAKAKEWGVDPNKVGVLGFSAGGHLAATVSTRYDNDERDAGDDIDGQTARPDLSVLLYPVITLEGVSAHVGSRKALLGDKPDPGFLDALSCDKHVTPHTPPAFLFHTVGDAGVPVENSMLYASALRKAGIPFEMHLFERGKHGVGLAKDDPVLAKWTELCANWLKLQKFGRA